MRNKSVYRGILIIAGLLAAAVIVFSHSFAELGEEKASAITEKPSENTDQETVIQVPAEAVTQANAVKIDEQVPDTVLETLTPSENPNTFLPETRKLAVKFFKVLFQTVIAPNAP